MSRSSFISREILCVMVRSIQNPRSLLRISLMIALGAIRASAATVEVAITNFAFEPGSITISQGDTVHWKNFDNISHTVTSDTGAFESAFLGPTGENS